MSIKIGGIFWPQATDWPALRDAAVAVDRAGWDSLWTWDHLFAIQGACEQSSFEGWTTLAAWAALTRDATVGLLVSAAFGSKAHGARDLPMSIAGSPGAG